MPKDANGKLIPGTTSPYRSVPASIPRPEYVGKPAPSPHLSGDRYDSETIEKIRKASRIAAQALEKVLSSAVAGITTNELDQIGHEFLLSQNSYPSTLGYRGFPKSLCTSVNEVICHGIPDDTVLEEGDLVNVDIGAFFEGVHGDTNGTVIIGQSRREVHELVDRTREALNRGIRAVASGREVNVIGRAIESYARRFGYGVVREFTGHGVGTSFHTGLIIPHYDDPAHRIILEPGMVFTIEPMITLGSPEWEMWEDDWTVTTRDQSITAQFEHTIILTEEGPEILTEV
jgi:methionyl aminopeptidase